MYIHIHMYVHTGMYIVLFQSSTGSARSWTVRSPSGRTGASAAEIAESRRESRRGDVTSRSSPSAAALTALPSSRSAHVPSAGRCAQVCLQYRHLIPVQADRTSGLTTFDITHETVILEGEL